MKTAKVRFAGVCLFVRRSDAQGSTVDVLLPNCLDGRDHPDGHRHPQPHWAWLVSTDGFSDDPKEIPAPNGRLSELLYQTQIAITGGKEKLDPSGLTDLVRFKDFLYDTSLRAGLIASPPPPIVAGRVRIDSGTFAVSVTNASEVTWKLRRPRNGLDCTPTVLAYNIDWTVEGEDLRLVLTTGTNDGNLKVPIGETGLDHFVVGNLPKRSPSRWRDIETGKCGSAEPRYNHFKWLYRLLEPTGSQSWQDVIGAGGFPVPVGVCKDNVEVSAITTSTCVPGEWP